VSPELEQARNAVSQARYFLRSAKSLADVGRHVQALDKLIDTAGWLHVAEGLYGRVPASEYEKAAELRTRARKLAREIRVLRTRLVETLMRRLGA